MLTRRALLQSAIAFSATAALAPAARAFAAGEAVYTVRTKPEKPITVIPGNFIGLGYEMSSAARPGLLSAKNAAYVQLLRNLGPNGVLRMGGIVSDFTSYSANGQVMTEPKNTVLTRASLHQLRGFLDVTGWTALWSLNFGRGTLDEAILEIRDVAHILGPRLYAIELGNEVENYSHGQHPLRKPPYSYEEFRMQYTHWRKAILAVVPGLHFAAPDTAASIEWVERMASDAHGDVQLLTTHYYRGDQKLGTQDQLMHEDTELKSHLERLHRASRESGIPWRMCEINSFFGGGRPGISDTLAGALWTLDSMLLLAQSGCAGVNIETGVNQLGFISSYSPIQDDGAGHNTAGAPYYGMLAYAAATRGAPDVFSVAISKGVTNLKVYALGAGERVRSLVLINKATDQQARVAFPGLPLHRVSALRLTGPSLSSTAGVTFGNATVDASGKWNPAEPAHSFTRDVIVPASSALVIRLP